MNTFIDTRGNVVEPYSFTEAIVCGIAPGGGLFVPQAIPTFSVDAICALADLPYAERAAFVYDAFDIDVEPADVTALMAGAYGDQWDDERIAPVVDLGDGAYVLELFHGPTSAFKDMALQCLPRFFEHATNKMRAEGTLDHDHLILVATSGDTGKAALEGFADRSHVGIAVFYPDGGVSDIQLRQMTTQRGDNVNVFAARGDFDDCQTSVKKAFGDAAFCDRLMAEHNVALSSANSINWGRLMPQIVYYMSAYADMVASGAIEAGDPIDVCVPTGNFGNILSAFYAKEMGLPIGRLLCASNSNNVLTDFIATGKYDRNRPFYNTVSPSMDILISSNLERLLYLLSGGDDKLVAGYMKELSDTGCYQVSEEMRKKIQSVFVGGFSSEAETEATIGKMMDEHKYLIDTHTAVAFHVLEQYRKETGDQTKTVVASTASPFKFCDAVLDALNVTDKATGTALLDQLAEVSGMPAPQPLATLKDKQVRFTSWTEKEQMRAVVTDFLK